MFSAAGLFVTFLNLHLNVGKYQAIVAGIALVLTAVQNPDGITSTSTGKGPAVALEKLRDRATGEYRRRLAARGGEQTPAAGTGRSAAEGGTAGLPAGDAGPGTADTGLAGPDHSLHKAPDHGLRKAPGQ
jgi:hypothetical protein